MKLGALSAEMIDVLMSPDVFTDWTREFPEFSGGETLFGVNDRVGGTDE